MGVDLVQEQVRLLLDDGDDIRAGDEPQRRGVEGGDGDDLTTALCAQDRQDGPGDVQRAEEVGLHLRPELPGTDVLEVARVEVARIVDEDVDAAEALDRSLSGGNRGAGVGDVERDGEQVLVLTDRSLDPVATTECPAARAACAMSMPRPRPAPVMNQTFVLLSMPPADAASHAPGRPGLQG